MVTNALARIAFIADRLEKAKLPTAVAAAMSGPNGAALRNHDTAWGMGVGGALVGSTVREVLTSHTVLPADQTALQAVLDRDGTRPTLTCRCRSRKHVRAAH